MKKFLSAHYKPHQFSVRVTNDGQDPVEYRLKQTRLALATSIRLTRKFRQQLVKQKIVVRSEVNGFRILAFDTIADGRPRSALLLYTGYGNTESKTKEKNKKKIKVLDWHRLQTADGITSRRGFVSVEEVELMYRVLLARMKDMGKGDQLSPDFKGKTPDIKSHTPTAQKTSPQKASPQKASPQKASPQKASPPKKKPRIDNDQERDFKENDDDDDDDL